ncbi:MAG TPA: hypothetical protein PKJ52_01240 [Rectinema sp.]|nr:hypothetical protein [Rectinema sp.]
MKYSVSGTSVSLANEIVVNWKKLSNMDSFERKVALAASIEIHIMGKKKLLKMLRKNGYIISDYRQEVKNNLPSIIDKLVPIKRNHD